MQRNKFGRRNFLWAASGFGAASALPIAAGEKQPKLNEGCITDVGSLRVGHFTHTERLTGCTVVLFDQPTVAGVDVRGSAPGTRETDLLNPVNTVQQIHAILLTGGSAFGLDAASGVMRYLEERGMGFHVGPAVVPIVPAAVLFDLNVGNPKIRPNAESGYKACEAAAASGVPEGCVGAGAGATVGKLFDLRSAMKSGIGSASVRIGGTDLVVGALIAVNAVGDVLDYETGKILAGARTQDGKGFLNSISQLKNGSAASITPGAHSTIGVIATNAALTKTEATKMAQMAHDGLARSINPIHTSMDGDTLFAAATGTAKTKADLLTVGAVGAEAVAQAVRNAVWAATSIPGYVALRDLPKT
ncbi:MAG: P1 family peptidase [Acidobacteriaceae bacterium]|nr:P1 family peptidase [Acidobacteriaceae bacterium]MBV9307309.1 P1 family peptidase [Acidobacteriaceae bacterium]